MNTDFFANLSKETQDLIQMLLEEPLEPPEALRAEVEEYQRQIKAAQADGETVDHELAGAIATSCFALIETLDSDVSESHHRFVQLACRYFVEQEDEDGDMRSMIGFDDDAEVLNLVADQLGLTHLKVSGLPGLN